MMLKPLKEIRLAPRAQSGSYILEALIAILIFSFGILGIVGLQASALRTTGDSQYRAEAAYLANSLVAQMWTDDRTVIRNKYGSVAAGAGYTTFKAAVASLPGATTKDPEVLFEEEIDATLVAPSTTSTVAQVRIYWLQPGEPVSLLHEYRTTAVIGDN